MPVLLRAANDLEDLGKHVELVVTASTANFTTFMEAEFDRLDKNKTGELDPKELAQSRVQVSDFLNVGK